MIYFFGFNLFLDILLRCVEAPSRTHINHQCLVENYGKSLLQKLYNSII